MFPVSRLGRDYTYHVVPRFTICCLEEKEETKQSRFDCIENIKGQSDFVLFNCLKFNYFGDFFHCAGLIKEKLLVA